MKRVLAFGALACALALGACATGTASQDVEKSLIAAHATYDGISIALQTAATTGVLTGSAAQTAQTAYDQVGQDLAAADAAYAAGNTALVTSEVSAANADAAKATALVPPAHLCTSSHNCNVQQNAGSSGGAAGSPSSVPAPCISTSPGGCPTTSNGGK